MTEPNHSAGTKRSLMPRIVTVLILVSGAIYVFRSFADRSDDVQTERLSFTLHWEADPGLPRFVSYDADGSPLHPVFGVSSALLQHVIDGQEYNGIILYRKA